VTAGPGGGAPPPNTDIPLYDGWIRVRDSAGLTSTGRGSVFLAWQPVPRIRFQAVLPTLLTDERPTVQFAISRRRASGSTFVTNTQIGNNRGYLETGLEGFFERGVEVGSGRGLSFVTFELPNFPEIETTLTTAVAQWTVAIARSGSTQTFTTLRRDGGYALTGTGRIERTDGRPFDAPAVAAVMDSLFHFLSFATGMWSQPTLLSGYDNGGNVIWQSWEVWRSSRWELRPHWLPRRTQQNAMDLFRAWHARWSDPYWKEVLERTTYFFVDANRSIVDIGLLTSQSALETLCYAISVVDRKSITASAFDARSYPASMKIRGLLADVGIPVAVPGSLTALAGFTPAPTIGDGPSKVTWLRNRLVHPLKSARTPANSTEIYEAWRLALWYVEASLLALLGYTGTVWSRVSLADEPFP
jgi:hypothetical protein